MKQLSTLLADPFIQISASPLKAALAYSTAKCSLQGLPSGGKKVETLSDMSQKFHLLSVCSLVKYVRPYMLGPFPCLSELDSACDGQRKIG